MEDKKFTQGITPENFLEPRTWTFAGYSQQTSGSQGPKTAPFQEEKAGHKQWKVALELPRAHWCQVTAMLRDSEETL